MHHSNVYKFPTRARPHDFFARSGWVYVLGNELMPDVFKVGSTTRSVEQRMRELYTTGVPMGFDCMFAEWFADCRHAEAFIHGRLEEARLVHEREFFAAELWLIRQAFMEYSAVGEDVPDEMVDLYSKRRRAAESTERVNGVLIARTAHRFSSPEVPF